MGGNQKPGPTCSSDRSDIDAGTSCLHLSPLAGPVGIGLPKVIGPLHLELPTPPPQPAKTQSAPPPTPPKPPTPPGPPQDLTKLIKGLLEKGNFDVPGVLTEAEAATDASPDSRAFFSYVVGRNEGAISGDAPQEMTTVDNVAGEVYHELLLNHPTLKRDYVVSVVLQVYKDKLKEARDKHWQFNLSLFATPTYFYWANQSMPSPWQNGWQLTPAGATYQAHAYGRPGFEHQLSLQVGVSSLDPTTPDWFQNALAVYQLAYVSPLGREFRFPGASGLWAYLSGSVFAQVAAGVGRSGGNTVYLGLMTQEVLGGMLALNIGHLSIYLGAQNIYNYVTPIPFLHYSTGARPFSAFGGQGFLGVGGSF